MRNLAEVVSKGQGAFGFGLESENVVAALRMLADQIELGDAIPQSVGDASTAGQDDFTTRTVTITFVAKRNGVEPA